MKRTMWTILALALVESSCLAGASSPTPPGSPSAFGIQLAEVGVPAGWMGQDSKRLQDAIRLEGAEATECGGASTCLRISYQPKWGWAGVYWWPTGCDQEGDPWAAVRSGTCAVDLRKDQESRPIQRLTFAARGAKGGETLTFGVGGDNLHPKKVQRRIVLGSTWQTHEIDLRRADLKKVTGLFFWTASELDNPSGFVVYLKDMQFTGGP
jgi:hypothetical protein